MNDRLKINEVEGGALRVAVDLNRCLAYAQCCFLAPGVFELHGQEALRYHPQPDVAELEAVVQAVAACPVQAITAEFPEGEQARQPSVRELPR